MAASELSGRLRHAVVMGGHPAQREFASHPFYSETTAKTLVSAVYEYFSHLDLGYIIGWKDRFTRFNLQHLHNASVPSSPDIDTDLRL